MLKKHWPLLLILLIGLLLRTWQLTTIPPGLTHDEANHGREAIEILDGVLRYYFPLNYGSEPIYSYTVAGAMALLGETLFALRLVNVVFGLLAIVAIYFWSQRAFNHRTAILTAGLIAVSFWPIASSREALRAGMLPFFMTLTVIFFWHIVESAKAGKRNWTMTVAFALGIIATFHIYLAARTAWLLFPAFLVYLLVAHRDTFRQAWLPVLTGLVLALVGLLPMFVYLQRNPASQTRLGMLDSTLEQVFSGNLAPIFTNVGEALLAFGWPGFGDQFIAYNIPGKPVLNAISAVFLIVGVLVCLWRWRRPAYSFTLLWWLTGIIPSLVTGATANTTRNLAALPATYLLPVLGFWASAEWLSRRFEWNLKKVGWSAAVVWLALTSALTLQDYFARWSQLPIVRDAYQSTLVAELDYWQEQATSAEITLISSPRPGPAHDASIALVLTGDTGEQLRWFDARQALVLPSAETQALISDATTPHPAFDQWLTPLNRVELRPDDLDPAFTHYAVDSAAAEAWHSAEPLADFNGAIELLDAQWLTESTSNGDSAELLTVWRVVDPAAVGPIHTPTDTTETIFFTQVLSPDGAVVTQADALHAPSWNWHSGEIILQVHTLPISAEMSPDSYTTIVGIYDPITMERLPLTNGETFFTIAPLSVSAP